MVFMQKQIEKNLNGTWDPPSWKIPSKISILFFGLPPIYHELFYFMMVLITGTYLLYSAFPWTKLGFLCTIFLSFLLRWTRLAAYFPISSSQQDPHSKDALQKLSGKSHKCQFCLYCLSSLTCLSSVSWMSCLPRWQHRRVKNKKEILKDQLLPHILF